MLECLTPPYTVHIASKCCSDAAHIENLTTVVRNTVRGRSLYVPGPAQANSGRLGAKNELHFDTMDPTTKVTPTAPLLRDRLTGSVEVSLDEYRDLVNTITGNALKRRNPDKAAPYQKGAVYETTGRCWLAPGGCEHHPARRRTLQGKGWPWVRP